ncbi:hypothetical protein FOC84_06530 [Achromobacter pestifer]|uniref:Uncharacterized protein n=1 Tax=Achromobacter pestifer TaxID=1353889 RepID=A0A7D4DVU2_9BURK|nr:hypothetical protein [Achromobacter pestifer]QKH34625.1 hypothetical protein FOC84_06530 [Achromobacter pestifer]
MTDKAEFERLLDVYGFRCERFGQDLSTHARAQVVSTFAALASAPVADERPLGAIINGRTLAERLEAYPFESEGGNLRLCSDWVEFRRCFEYLAEWASAPVADPAPEYAYGDDGRTVTMTNAARAPCYRASAPVAGEAKPVAWFIDWPEEPELGHYIAESPADSGRNRPLVFADASPQQRTPVSEEPVYAYRRKGLDDFVTCTRERFDELSAKPRLFETRIFYAAPQASEAELKEAAAMARSFGAPDMADALEGRASEADALIDALGQCRDAFPIPDIVGSKLDFLWQEAMSDPSAVPAYIKARAALSAQPGAQKEQSDAN